MEDLVETWVLPLALNAENGGGPSHDDVKSLEKSWRSDRALHPIPSKTFLLVLVLLVMIVC